MILLVKGRVRLLNKIRDIETGDTLIVLDVIIFQP